MERWVLSIVLTLLGSVVHEVYGVEIHNHSNVVLHPSVALATKRAEARERKCERIVQRHQAYEVQLEPGRLYLNNGQLVLVVDGHHSIPGQQFSGHWSWVEVLPKGFGRHSHGFNRSGLFTLLPKETGLAFDFRDAVIRLKNAKPTFAVKPDVFYADGHFVLLLRAGNSYVDGRYEFRVVYQTIGDDGHLYPATNSLALSAEEFQKYWHPVEGYRLSVSLLEGGEFSERLEN